MTKPDRRGVLGVIACRYLIAASICIPVGLHALGAAAFTPVDYRGPGATIRLSRLSTYDGGYFASDSVEVPPAYDASERRLYYIDKSATGSTSSISTSQRYLHRDKSIELGPAVLRRRRWPFAAACLPPPLPARPSRARAWSPSSTATADRRPRRSRSARNRRCWSSRRTARKLLVPGQRRSKRRLSVTTRRERSPSSTGATISPALIWIPSGSTSARSTDGGPS